MPGTVAEELELQIEQGHGALPPSSFLDGGGDRGGSRPIPRRAYITGITMLLGAITMFFMALASAYFVRGGYDDWRSFALPRILWADTFILILSSVTVEMARKQLARGMHAAFRNYWGLSTGLGLLFVGGQLIAWRQFRAEGLFVNTNPSSSFFYLFTAAHGLHLLGGIVALLYVAFRSWNRARTTQPIAAEITAIYWHFLDGLWVFLFLLLSLGR